MKRKSEQRASRTRKMIRKKPQPKPFRPTAAMQRFLRVELEFLSKRRPYTQKQVAEAAKVSEFQASRWHDAPGYEDWMTRELRHVAVRLFARNHHRRSPGHPDRRSQGARDFLAA